MKTSSFKNNDLTRNVESFKSFILVLKLNANITGPQESCLCAIHQILCRLHASRIRMSFELKRHSLTQKVVIYYTKWIAGTLTTI